MGPMISVIIPVYNPGVHLRKCLDSITGQTYENLEIILIDDGSTDGSDKVCDEYAAKDDRIVCVHQPNSGVSKARNAGLELAHGDYYHFPDSDDYLETDTYSYVISLMQKHGTEAVNFEHYITYPDHETAHCVRSENYGLFEGEAIHRILLEGEAFCCNKLYAARLIRGLRFREDIFRGEDSLFAHQALDRAEKVWFDKRPLYHYVQTEESACRGVFRPSQLSALRLYDAYKPLYSEKYPKLWNTFLLGYANLHTTLYFDMQTDKADYKSKQKELFSHYKELCRQIDWKNAEPRQKLKLRLFRFSPKAYVLIHKQNARR